MWSSTPQMQILKQTKQHTKTKRAPQRFRILPNTKGFQCANLAGSDLDVCKRAACLLALLLVIGRYASETSSEPPQESGKDGNRNVQMPRTLTKGLQQSMFFLFLHSKSCHASKLSPLCAKMLLNQCFLVARCGKSPNSKSSNFMGTVNPRTPQRGQVAVVPCLRQRETVEVATRLGRHQKLAKVMQKVNWSSTGKS